MRASLKDVREDMKGMEAYTGYGVGRAGFDGWMTAAMAGIAGIGGGLFFAGASWRRRRDPE